MEWGLNVTDVRNVLYGVKTRESANVGGVCIPKGQEVTLSMQVPWGNKKRLNLPRPNISSLMYVEAEQCFFRAKLLLDKFEPNFCGKDANGNKIYQVNKEFLVYDFFSHMIPSVTYAYTCIEAFVNQLLSIDERIEKKLDLSDKIKKKIPLLDGFEKISSGVSSKLAALKELRHIIIHPKPEQTRDPNNMRSLWNGLLPSAGRTKSPKINPPEIALDVIVSMHCDKKTWPNLVKRYKR